MEPTVALAEIVESYTVSPMAISPVSTLPLTTQPIEGNRAKLSTDIQKGLANAAVRYGVLKVLSAEKSV